MAEDSPVFLTIDAASLVIRAAKAFNGIGNNTGSGVNGGGQTWGLTRYAISTTAITVSAGLTLGSGQANLYYSDNGYLVAVPGVSAVTVYSVYDSVIPANWMLLVTFVDGAWSLVGCACPPESFSGGSAGNPGSDGSSDGSSGGSSGGGGGGSGGSSDTPFVTQCGTQWSDNLTFDWSSGGVTNVQIYWNPTDNAWVGSGLGSDGTTTWNVNVNYGVSVANAFTLAYTKSTGGSGVGAGSTITCGIPGETSNSCNFDGSGNKFIVDYGS